MNQRPSALVLSFSCLDTDPRVLRQIQFLLKMGYRVSACALRPPNLPEVNFFSCQAPTSSRKLQRFKQGIRRLCLNYQAMYWNNGLVKSAWEQLKEQRHDLYIANDWNTLPLAIHLAKEKKVLFDAHEYAPKEFEDRWGWSLLYQPYVSHLCKLYIPQADAMITVSKGIANEYERVFGVACSVITNAPPMSRLKPQKGTPGKIRLIYHGVAAPSRSVEDAVKIMDHLDSRFELDMILLPGCPSYIEKIKKMATRHTKIRFLEPVPTSQIPQLCNTYDLGFFPLRPTNFNYSHALPNKFFEFIQGRVGAAISPIPDMAEIVLAYRCGIVAQDFEPETFAKQLNGLTQEKIEGMKQNCEAAAQENCAEQNFIKFKQIIDFLA